MGMAMWVDTAVMNETRMVLALGAQRDEGLDWDAGTQRLWGGPHGRAGCISRLAPDGRLLRRISVPTSNATNVCFAGPGLDRLFVATARFGLAGAALQGQLEVVEPGVTGLPCLPVGLGWA